MIRHLFAIAATAASLALPIAAASVTTASAATASATASQNGSGVTNGEKFHNWEVSCQALGKDQTACMLTQKLLRSSDHVFMAQVSALWAKDGSKRYLAVSVPIGTYLAAGIAMRSEDSKKVHPLVWQSCNPKFCEALTELTPDLEKELTEGKGIVIMSYRPSLQSKPRTFNFDARGLGDGMAAVMPNS